MTNADATPETESAAVEPEVGVTGYGYLTDAEREAAIRDHNAAVKAKGRK